MKTILTICTGCCMFFFCCRAKIKKPVKETTATQSLMGDANYRFQTADSSWDLPSSLNEISGIGLINDSMMLCQEDENGMLYLYNLSAKQLDKTIPFGKPNDYEDLAIVGADVYILQSNGSIVQVANYLKFPVITKFKTTLEGKNDTEGLCYDSISGSLLVACKDKQDVAESTVNEKLIYTFNLQQKIYSGKPLLVFEETDFNPSALAVHPITGNIFILSAKKKKLVELNRQGSFINRYELKGKLFSQPEGITFALNGDVYISNEADGGKANILMFAYQKK